MLDPELAKLSEAPPEPGIYAGIDNGTGNTTGPYDVQETSRRSIPDWTREITSAPADSRLLNVQYKPPLGNPAPYASHLEGFQLGDSPGMAISSNAVSPRIAQVMPPPYRMAQSLGSPASRPRASINPSDSPEHAPKRLKLSQGESPTLIPGQLKQEQSFERPTASASIAETLSPNPGPLTPYSPFVSTPLTPGSSVASEETSLRHMTRPAAIPPQAPPELRRLSVNSLLSGPPGDGIQGIPFENHGRHYPVTDSATTTYGFDLGQPDLDTPKNDDANAITTFSPPASFNGPLFFEYASGDRTKNMAFEKDGYYSKPVPIKISKYLEPLPATILENPMNLLYFHHFLNHTARILVPHDCEKNPFRKILPQSKLTDNLCVPLLMLS